MRSLESQPSARFRKDILRVGKWRVGEESWDVTPDTLQEIVRNFHLAKSRGCDCPLVMNHSSDVRDRAGKVSDLGMDGDVLWSEFEAAPEAVDVLKVPGVGVSVRVTEKWRDGLGNTYPLALEHLGIVNHPVVPGQGPFVELSLIQEGKSMFGFGKKRDLAEGEGGDSMPSASAATLDDLKPVVDRLVKAAAKAAGAKGVTLPDSVTDENFLAVLGVIADVLEGMVGGTEDEEKPSEAPSAESVASLDPSGMGMAEMANAIKGLKSLTLSLLAQKQSDAEAEKVTKLIAFRSEMDRLAKSGIPIEADTRKQLETVGAATGYDLSLLKPFQSIKPTVHTKSKTLALADGSEPEIEKGQRVPFSQQSAEEQAKKLKAFTGR